MQTSIVFLVGALLSVSPVESANPIRKVVKLMQEMQKEIEVQKASEKALFEKFMCICTEYPPELRESIEAGTKNVDLLTSKIEEESANKEKLEQELIGHKQEKGSAEKDLSQATMLREKETAEYEATIASTTASVDALGKAVASLSKGATSAMLQQSGGVPQLQALVETSNFVSSFDRERVIAFLTGNTASSDSSPGSGEVVGILKQMKADMEATLVEAEKSEKIAAQGYADLKAAKDKEIEVASESIEAKEKKSGEFEVSIAQSTDALDDTKSEIKDSQAMLSLLESTCEERTKEWQGRIKMRDDEIAAISEAITILNDDDALDVFKKAVPAAAASGFLQTRHGKSFAVQGLEKAVEIVKDALKIPKSHKTKLELLMYKMKTQLRYAQSSNAKEFPDMTGVAKMTEDMIAVLKSEMEADEEKKEWCTTELEKSEAELTRKQEILDQQKAAISQTEDEISGVSDEIKTLETEIVEIDKEVAGSAEQRKKEHAEYTENGQMTEVAVSLVEKAKNRLQKFYNPTLYKAPPKKEGSMEDKITASYAAFIQRHSSVKQPKAMPDLPELPKYEKQNSGGIVHLLDDIVKQLEMDKVESGSEEKTAQKEYVEFMADAQVNRAQDAKSVVQAKAKKAELEKRLVVLKEDAGTMSEEVYQAHQLIGEVHSACDFVLDTFKERAAARAGEIESLENAKSVLNGAANLMSR